MPKHSLFLPVQIFVQAVQKHCLKSQDTYVIFSEIKMAISTKKLSIYAFAGVAFATIIIAAIFTSGVQFPINQSSGNSNTEDQNTLPLTANMGTLRVLVTDAPAELDKLMVTIDEIEVNGGGGWTQLTLDQTGPFDLLELNGVSLEVSSTPLEAGTYSKVRLHIKEATAYYTNNPEEEVTLRVPSGKLDIIIKLQINEGEVTTLLIDIQPDSVAISNSGNLKPVLKATVLNPTSTDEPPTQAEATEEPTTSSTEEPSPTPDETSPTPTPEQTPDQSNPTPTPDETSPTPTPEQTPDQSNPTPTPDETTTPTTSPEAQA
jgi:hypothetical protein